MKTVLPLIALLTMFASFALSQPAPFQDELLDRLAGEWVMEGIIAGKETTHDLVADWVLGHNYLRFQERSRERNEKDEPEYEAIVFIGWDEPSDRYVCLWLDCTGGSGLRCEGLGYGERQGDEIPFVWDDGSGSIIHNTFRYVPSEDYWTWRIDLENEESRRSFAKVSLRRR